MRDRYKYISTLAVISQVSRRWETNFLTKRSYIQPSVNSGVASSLSRTMGIKRKSFIQGLKYDVLGELSFLRRIFYEARQRVRQIFPENLFRRSRYISVLATRYEIGRNRPTPRCLFTWPCLLCARVIHFFLLGCTSRRVVDRPAPDVIIFYGRPVSIYNYRLCIRLLYSFNLVGFVKFIIARIDGIFAQKISKIFSHIFLCRMTKKKNQ